jgi:hypothetical protein
MPNVIVVMRFFVVRWFLPLSCIDSLPCAGFCHCRAALFIVRLIDRMLSVDSLLCIFLVVHGKDFFVMQGCTAKNGCTPVPGSACFVA